VPKVCKPDCRFLSPTEAEQEMMIKPWPPHMCRKYNQRVRHVGYLYPGEGTHPDLLALPECDGIENTLWDHLMEN